MSRTEVEIPAADGRTMRGELHIDGATGSAAGVVLVHELTGLDGTIREAASRLADHGYAVLAVDLFGHRGGRLACLMRELGSLVAGPGPGSQLLADVESAVVRDELVRRQEGIDGSAPGATVFHGLASSIQGGAARHRGRSASPMVARR